MKTSVNGSAQANSPTDRFVLLRETCTHGFTVRHVEDVRLCRHGHRLLRLGIIPRSYTEQLLASKPVGTYLVRINEKIFGYALSYRASDHCRHLLIEVILSSKRDDHRLKQHAYRFLGGAKHELFTQLNQLIEKYSVSVQENVPIHSSLSPFIRIHRYVRIRPMSFATHAAKSTPTSPTTPIYFLILSMTNKPNLCTYRSKQRHPHRRPLRTCSGTFPSVCVCDVLLVLSFFFHLYFSFLLIVQCHVYLCRPSSLHEEEIPERLHIPPKSFAMHLLLTLKLSFWCNRFFPLAPRVPPLNACQRSEPAPFSLSFCTIVEQ